MSSLRNGLPSKVRATNGVRFVPSSVDETLFGERQKAREPVHMPDFEPPWVDNGSSKLKTLPRPLLFYCPITSPSVDCAKPPSAPSSYQPIKFSPPYVDDSLFGRRTKRSDSPPPREFKPPWVKESDKEKDKPILFDCNPRLMFDNRSSESSRPPSKLSRRPQTTGNITSSRSPVNYKKAPWR